jgi:heptosyltransferase-2
VAERYLETVSHLGITNDGKGLELFLPPQTDNEIRKHLASLPAGRRVIGMAPSAMHRNKMWPADRFAETAASIADEHDGAILLFGSAEDRNLCAEVQRMIKQRCSGAYVLNLAGETSLLQAGALMDRCDVVVTNDSGLMHLAAARKRKIVAIFGPTVKEFGFFPYGTTSTVVEVAGLPCRPCTHIGLERCPKRHFRCMNDISSAAVTGAVRAFLQST